MAAKFCIAICTVAVANANSWYKTITPSENTMLCLDLPGGNPYNGNMLWLWECNGMDGQIWVFDDYQIRYGANEEYCIDASDMSDGTQLMLWECNGLDQQRWGYDDKKVYIDGASTCLDLWESDQFNGQALHVWECNGLANQEWDLWDAGAPSGPTPSPPTPGPPSPGGGDYHNSCDDQSGGDWPVFNDQSSLSSDPQWSQYFTSVYGEVPSFGYPICLSGFRMIHLQVLHSAGISINQVSHPKSPGDFYTGDEYKNVKVGFIKHDTCSGQCFGSNQWVEGLHCGTPKETASAWYYFATGSGVWINSGSTQAWKNRKQFQKDMGFGHKCKSFDCSGELFTTAKNQFGLDTVQYMDDGKSQGGNLPMFIHTTGVGSNTCGASNTPWKAGWGAQSNCDCDQSQTCQNCKGYSFPTCYQTMVAV